MEKGSFSIVVFWITPNENILAFSFLHHFSLDWFCARIVGKIVGGERERWRVCDEVGVLDRTKEEGPGLDSSYYMVEPFGV